MPIYLHTDIIQTMIREKFASFEGFTAAWEDRAASNKNFPKARQRASMYRWIKEGVNRW